MANLHSLLLCGVSASLILAAPAVGSQTCKPDVRWSHEHPVGDDRVKTTDVKGTRATILEICRNAGEPTPGLLVEVRFDGSNTSHALEPGRCEGTFARWAVIRSQGAKQAQAPARPSGVYRVCKE